MLDFFDELIGDEPVALGPMSDRIPKHSSTWRTRWQSLNGSLEDAEEGAISWDRDYRGRRALIALAAMIVFGLLIALDLGAEPSDRHPCSPASSPPCC